MLRSVVRRRTAKLCLVAMVLSLAAGCKERETARLGIGARVNVCYAYRRSAEASQGAADVMVSMLPSQSAIAEYLDATDGMDTPKIAEFDGWAAKLPPGTKLRMVRRNSGWMKVLVLNTPDGTVEGYVLEAQCHALPPKGVFPR